MAANDDAHTNAQPERQEAVKAAFLHAWRSYEEHAWGDDEVNPLSRTSIKSFGMGLTLVDSLDTMHLMGLSSQFAAACEWVKEELTFGTQEDVNVFEVTIRILGGLLSAYELSSSTPLLDAAEELGLRMLFAFDTPTGLPYGTIGLRSGRRYNPGWAGGASTIAEVGTLQLEFRALSRHTGNPAFEAVAQRIMAHLRNMRRPPALPAGLYPTFISPTSGQFTSQHVTLGARADSLYEYLLKQWLFSSKTDARVRSMYAESVRSIMKHLVKYGGLRCNNCSYIGSWNFYTKAYTNSMDHLVCFVPGMLALGVQQGVLEEVEHMAVAEHLMRTCYKMYADSPTGLAPEIATFRNHERAVAAESQARHNLLRPETIESLFILWRQTANDMYREWGWEIFQAIERHCKISGGGYSGLKDVTQHGVEHNGKMESFFTAETLKYLWLLFSDGSVIPLEQYVFNTEAHPLKIYPEYQAGAEFGYVPEPHEVDEVYTQWMRLPGAPDKEDVRVRSMARAQLLAKTELLQYVRTQRQIKELRFTLTGSAAIPR